MRQLSTSTYDSVRPVTTDVGQSAAGEQVYLVVHELPRALEQREGAVARLATKAGVRPAELARLLAELPHALPVPLDAFREASKWISECQALGISVSVEPCPGHFPRCARHPRLHATETCSRCQRAGCAACTSEVLGKPRCPSCRAMHRFVRGFFLARVSLLLTVLLLVSLWGYHDVRSRGARTHWDRTLSVSIVLITTAPVDPAAIELFEQRLPVLEERLAQEFWHYRSGPRPFRLVLSGTLQAGPPPTPPADGLIALAKHSYRQWRYLSEIDDALGLEADRYDSRLYVVARPPASDQIQFVEGYSQHGGRVGIVEVELSKIMVDLVLAVTAHELLHTLGAEDKYDESGRTLIPAGLAEPDKVPRFPQDYVEVMARNRPVSTEAEQPLETLDELGVGPLTAQEVGWSAVEH